MTAPPEHDAADGHDDDHGDEAEDPSGAEPETMELAGEGAADRPTVALLGTGIMGTGMAHAMLRAGIPVRAWNRTRERAEPLADDGAEVAASVADAVAGAELVVTMLTDAEATAEVAAEALPAMDAGAIWVQMGTIGVAGARRMEELATEHGVPLVDAPVSGTKQPAEQGSVVVLASGPEPVRPRVQKLFDAVGSRTVWVDDGPGSGSRLKLVVNDWLCGMVGALAEAVVLAEQLDLDPQVFLDAVAGGPLDAPLVGLKGGIMLDRAYVAAFPAKHAAKDVDLVLEAAGDLGLDLPVTAGVRALFERVLDAGRGDEDLAVLAEGLRADLPDR